MLDRTLGCLIAAASVLVLPVSLLLFLQWPLREWLQAYSREANDLAQVLFALYVSVAITAATRNSPGTGSHATSAALERKVTHTSAAADGEALREIRNAGAPRMTPD